MAIEIISQEITPFPPTDDWPRPKHQQTIVALLHHLLAYLQQHPLDEVLIAPIHLIINDLSPA